MTPANVVFWSGAILGALACIAALVVVVFAAMRRLAVIAAAVILVGFAFEPEAQLRFTTTLLGALVILYLLALLGVWVWHRMGRPHPRLRAQVAQPSALEFAHYDFADEEAHVTVGRQAKAAKDAREQEEHTARARDLERQGAFSLWSRP